MYASNEHEFNREEKEWVFLPSTSPIVCQHLSDLYRTIATDDEITDDDESSSVLSSSESTGESNVSINSATTTEKESNVLKQLANIQQEEISERQNVELSKETIQTSKLEGSTDTIETEVGDQKPEECLSATAPLENEDSVHENSDDSNVEQPVANYGIMSETTQSLFDEKLSDIDMTSSTNEVLGDEQETIFQSSTASTQSNKSNLYGLLIFIMFIYFMSAHMSPNDRPVIDMLEKKLMRTNERLNTLQSSSMDEIEQQLSKQFDDKLYRTIAEILTKYEKEHLSMLSRVSTVDEKSKEIEAKLLNNINQLTQENTKLEEKIRSLEERLVRISKQQLKTKGCLKGRLLQKSSKSPLETVRKPMVTPTGDERPSNGSKLFNQWTKAVGHIFVQPKQILERSKETFSNFVKSPTVETVQKSLKKSVFRVVRSLRSSTPNYATWIESRAEQRDIARILSDKKNNQMQAKPWRWTFQRSQDRESLRVQPQTTKIHPVNFFSTCPSLYNYPINPCCASKFGYRNFY